MNKTLAVSHIFVISEDQTITDLGEYSYSKLRISNNYAKEINGDNFRGTFEIEGIPGNATTLVIDYPATKTERLFISSDYEIPIDQIFSRSNPNGDCIIYGKIRTTPVTILNMFGALGGYEITIIEPYSPTDVAQRLFNEVKVHNSFIDKGARYDDNQEEVTQTRIKPKRPNPIVERIKMVQL